MPWYRAGSPLCSCGLAKAHSIGFPLPLPNTFIDRRVNDFDDRRTSRFICCRLALRRHSKPYASAFDNDRFTAFGGIEKQRKFLFRRCGRKSLHGSYYTTFQQVSETDSAGASLTRGVRHDCQEQFRPGRKFISSSGNSKTVEVVTCCLALMAQPTHLSTGMRSLPIIIGARHNNLYNLENGHSVRLCLFDSLCVYSCHPAMFRNKQISKA